MANFTDKLPQNCKVGMRNFQDTFETCNWPFICDFSICMTVPLMNLRKGLELLFEKIKTNKIIIKPADNGSIIVVVIPKDYWNMCYRYLSDAAFYNNLNNNDPSTVVQDS